MAASCGKSSIPRRARAPSSLRGRLDERERGDRRRVGAQDARTEAQPQDPRDGEDRRSLAFVEAAFGPDEETDAGLRLRPRQARPAGPPAARPRRRRRAGARPAIAPSASSSGSSGRTSGVQITPHCSQASMALASSRSRLSRATWVRRVTTGLRRRAAHLDRLLRHVVESGVLQRREQEIEVGRRFLIAGFARRRRASRSCARLRPARRRIRRLAR